jgi:hypothetical protein
LDLWRWGDRDHDRQHCFAQIYERRYSDFNRDGDNR